MTVVCWGKAFFANPNNPLPEALEGSLCAKKCRPFDFAQEPPFEKLRDRALARFDYATKQCSVPIKSRAAEKQKNLRKCVTFRNSNDKYISIWK